MRILTPFFILLFAFQLLQANDGVFYTAGNHLIPIQETEISVAKEVLKIKRTEEKWLDIYVDYEFFNPGKEKTLLVGFEAAMPFGDANWASEDGSHPYMTEFSVELNGDSISHQTGISFEEEYYQDNELKTRNISSDSLDFLYGEFGSFTYVYHFDAAFKKGLNRLKHHYRFKISESVSNIYSLTYILTAANRWANNQIDDFTLEIDLGPFQDFYMMNTFFDQITNSFTNQSSWKVNGKAEIIGPDKVPVFFQNDVYYTYFSVLEGPITFKQKNFHPDGELHLAAERDFSFYEDSAFNYLEHKLPFRLDPIHKVTYSQDETSFKILRNYPWARRGYIFQTPEIQRYYESLLWYKPNPDYQPKLEDGFLEELIWLKEVKDNGVR
jgi:hypothetical protein